MYELIQVGKNTYYINCPAKIGIYKINETDVCLIDSGNDKEAGKKVLKILSANQWTLRMIINTHSHADHIGGNNLLQQRTNCLIYMSGIDIALATEPILEPSFLYGGYPCKELRNKFLLAQPSQVAELTEDVLPQGLQMLRIDGHSFSQVALKTDDNIWFLADVLTGPTILEKYHISYLYDVAKYIDSLKLVNTLDAALFIPSHAEPVEDVSLLMEMNLHKINEIIELLKEFCLKPCGFEDLLKLIFEKYELHMDLNQYVLVGSTIRSYLAYLQDKGEIIVDFSGNKLQYQVKVTL